MISLTEMHRNRLADFLRVSRWLMKMVAWTFVTGPALIFFLLFIIGSRPNIGASILGQAEHMLRDAPPGQVWGCKPTARHVTDQPSPTPIPLLCAKQPESREAWINEANATLNELYILSMLISFIAGLCMWRFKKPSTTQEKNRE